MGSKLVARAVLCRLLFPRFFSSANSHFEKPLSVPPDRGRRQKTPYGNPSRWSWQKTGKLQMTLANEIVMSGRGLHSGVKSVLNLLPANAGEGRYFIVGADCTKIPASLSFLEDGTRLCTTLIKNNVRLGTVEHLLSALEGLGVDNCRIKIEQGNEVPLLDGSAKEWVEAVREVGLSVAANDSGITMERLALVVHAPMNFFKDGSFVVAFPSPKIRITYGIDFPQAPAIGCQWFSCFGMDEHVYMKEIAASRTFCIYEEVEQLRMNGLIAGGSVENAIVCSTSEGWLNPPLRFHDEPCRHKVLDLVGDLSLLASNGNQGFPVAHIIVFKGGHFLHTSFARHLMNL
ncbi:probable UDP-3-O-acyl-N-acetylglucosamine deacetylase 2 isoform X2 [Amborella trichopoda]|uniref:probable UDP-3-O-acyl-N-acetylglucosamine deacetylase 2 isoform X2 n=1 Tax=Amborella trichopoda TaxID=13333 RepID=UPI0005D3111F|nr:probable UDP-3-O-acyl-N-acetylglucosamine deacetylase 2 isoform X2 [Amborella trichopoda]|eukprot:XP_011628055.1 probable UDP-3-O-acyl-N-acetylglucosamine deacetylase 2 isoform X2 [Amborella trichopoda]